MKKSWKIGMGLITFGALLAGVAGCGSTSSNGSNTTNTAATTTTVSSTGKPTIAVLLYSLQYQWMVGLKEGIQKEADKQGVNVVFLDGQSSSQTQINQIEDELAKHVTAIILDPNATSELVPGVVAANQAGVPVVTVDDIVTGGNVFSSVTFDNVAGGKMAAQYIENHLKSGTVLDVEGQLGEYHAVLRNKGFADEIANDKSLTVIPKTANWSSAQAQTVTTDVITAHPDVKAIFSANDDMPTGIDAGLKQLGKLIPAGQPGHIMLVGLDGDPTALERIKQGYEDASVNQDPFQMGAVALDATVAAINHKSYQKMVYVPPLLITKDNVNDQSLWGNQMK